MNSFEGPPADNGPEEAVELNPNERVFKLGEKEYRAGDKVVVVRSDGTVEQDWELKSIGDKFAVVEKVNVNEGGVFRKVVPVGEFQDAQTIPEKVSARDTEMGGRQPSPETTAQQLGLETKGKSLEQINEEVTKKIREITGV